MKRTGRYNANENVDGNFLLKTGCRDMANKNRIALLSSRVAMASLQKETKINANRPWEYARQSSINISDEMNKKLLRCAAP